VSQEPLSNTDHIQNIDRQTVFTPRRRYTSKTVTTARSHAMHCNTAWHTEGIGLSKTAYIASLNRQGDAESLGCVLWTPAHQVCQMRQTFKLHSKFFSIKSC